MITKIIALTLSFKKNNTYIYEIIIIIYGTILYELY